MVADINLLAAKINEKFGAEVQLENRLGQLTLIVAAADANKIFVELLD